MAKAKRNSKGRFVKSSGGGSSRRKRRGSSGRGKSKLRRWLRF